jgi:hypothetical protein
LKIKFVKPPNITFGRISVGNTEKSHCNTFLKSHPAVAFKNKVIYLS